MSLELSYIKRKIKIFFLGFPYFFFVVVSIFLYFTYTLDGRTFYRLKGIN